VQFKQGRVNKAAQNCELHIYCPRQQLRAAVAVVKQEFKL